MIENPDDSFIWLLGLFQWPGFRDARFPPCMVGDEIAKPTRVRTLGIRLPSLKPRCTWYQSKGVFKGGRTRENPHVHLSSNKPGERRMKTSEAATYQPGTVKAWAADIRQRSLEVTATGGGISSEHGSTSNHETTSTKGGISSEHGSASNHETTSTGGGISSEHGSGSNHETTSARPPSNIYLEHDESFKEEPESVRSCRRGPNGRGAPYGVRCSVQFGRRIPDLTSKGTKPKSTKKAIQAVMTLARQSPGSDEATTIAMKLIRKRTADRESDERRAAAKLDGKYKRAKTPPITTSPPSSSSSSVVVQQAESISSSSATPTPAPPIVEIYNKVIPDKCVGSVFEEYHKPKDDIRRAVFAFTAEAGRQESSVRVYGGHERPRSVRFGPARHFICGR